MRCYTGYTFIEVFKNLLQIDLSRVNQYKESFQVNDTTGGM